MRKKLLLTFLSLLYVLGLNAANTLWIDDFSINQNETKEVWIKMSNTDPISMIMFDVVLPDGLSIVTGSNGNPEAELYNSRIFYYHQISTSIVDDNPRFLVQPKSTNPGNEISNCNGQFVKISVAANRHFYGSPQIYITNVSATDAQSNPVSFSTTPTTVTGPNNSLWIDNFSIVKGETKEVWVNLKNEIPVCVFRFGLILPEGLSVVTDENGKPEASLSTSSIFQNHGLTTAIPWFSTIPNYLVTPINSDESTIIGCDGHAVLIKLKASDDFGGGDIYFDYPFCADEQNWDYEMSTSPVTVTVSSKLWIDDFSIAKGEEKDVYVNLNAGEPIKDIDFKLVMTDGLSVATDSEGWPDITLCDSPALANYTIMKGYTGGKLTVYVVSHDDALITDYNGPIVKVKFKAPEDFTGPGVINFNDAIYYDAQDEPHDFITPATEVTLATDYKLAVAGVRVTSSNASNITGPGISGTVTYDYGTNTLTLRNASVNVSDLEGDVYPITNDMSAPAGLIIKLEGISALVAKDEGNAIFLNESDGFTIMGSGVLICDGDIFLSAFKNHTHNKTMSRIKDCSVAARNILSNTSDLRTEQLTIENAIVIADCLLVEDELILENCYVDSPFGGVPGTGGVTVNGSLWNGHVEIRPVSTVVVYGDVNGDGEVTSADITAIYNYLLNGDETFPLYRLDVNGDGYVTSVDVTAVYDVLLGNYQPPVEHTYVDLGLPSGTLWATMNIGANSPEDYGDYFAWGETAPKDDYTFSTYQWCNGSKSKLTKYCTDSSYGNNGFVDDKTELELDDDAARVNWGAEWKIPSKEQFKELIDNCSSEWTTQNGVYGWLFTSGNGATLFFPAAGARLGDNLSGAGEQGYYWSRSLYTTTPYEAYCLRFSDSPNVGSNYVADRRIGHCVRPVRVAQK